MAITMPESSLDTFCISCVLKYKVTMCNKRGKKRGIKYNDILLFVELANWQKSDSILNVTKIYTVYIFKKDGAKKNEIKEKRVLVWREKKKFCIIYPFEVCNECGKCGPILKLGVNKSSKRRNTLIYLYSFYYSIHPSHVWWKIYVNENVEEHWSLRIAKKKQFYRIPDVSSYSL